MTALVAFVLWLTVPALLGGLGLYQWRVAHVWRSLRKPCDSAV